MGNNHPSNGNLFLSQEQKHQANKICDLVSFIEDYVTKVYNQDLKSLIDGSEAEQEQAICAIYNIYIASFQKWDPLALKVGSGDKFISANVKKRQIGRNLGSLKVTDSEDTGKNAEFVPQVSRKLLCHDIIRYVVEKVKLVQLIK